MQKDKYEVCLHCENIDKIYPGTKALDSVCFDVVKGKVNVLIGENGAGKSTLMKIVAGIEQPSSGKISMDGDTISFKDTTEARKHGIGIIHQELSLFPNLNVYQNIFMANEKTTKIGVVDNKKHYELAVEVLNHLEYPIDPDTLVGDLKVGQQQMIEIARNLIQSDLKILIMDEPTSSLSAQEVEVLFKIMKELNEKGISIVYISHRLEEIMRIGDYVTILRDGKYIDSAEVKNIDISWIVKQMVGKGKSYPQRAKTMDYEKAETVLEIKDLTLPKKGGGYLLDKVSFDVKKGEILGIYGLLGAGRTELFECIMGMHKEHTGEIFVNGEQVMPKSIDQQMNRGFAWVPEDRQREGLIQTQSIGKNISIASLSRYMKGFFVDKKIEDEAISDKINEVHIKVADKNLPILSLSGGNQQKVVIAKGILTQPKILLLDEPSRGIDIGAKTEVFEIMNHYADDGLTLIVVSSELDEIKAISDRIIVLSNGKKTAELQGDAITEDNLVMASYKGFEQKKEETNI
ncbi:MAG: sugar ABC transporter ATP-binding protein [Breznakia sp.]